jgi:CheY-like chemotaxis protein
MSRHLILHVEDDPNDVFLFSRAFKKAELHADLQTIEDGEALINQLTTMASNGSRLPSLLLLDIKLPRKSGFEVLQWLREHPIYRRLPVLMLTSSAQPDDVTNAYNLGVNGYLVKPMDMIEAAALFNSIDAFWLKLNVSCFAPSTLSGNLVR